MSSGAGKALIAAVLSGINFVKCVGIELMPGLCEASRDVIESLQKCLDSNSPGSPYTRSALNMRSNSLLEIREGDVLTEDWSDADFLYISSICFSDATVDALFEKGRHLKPLSVIASLKLPTVGFY